MGDSISIHYGSFLQRYIKDTLEYECKGGEGDIHDADGNPIGANGGDSNMVVGYLKERFKSAPIKADYILINCGLWDIKTDKESASRSVLEHEYQSNLREMIASLLHARIFPVWVRTTGVDESLHNLTKPFNRFLKDIIRYNEIADSVMFENRVPVIDLFTFTNTIENAFVEDGVHFTGETRARQAAFIAGSLGQIIPKTNTSPII